MTIETKFKPGFRAFVLVGSKLEMHVIDSIKIDIKESETKIDYWINLGNDTVFNFKSYDESEIFESKEEFLNQL